MPEVKPPMRITTREKLVVILTVFLIKMLKPWEFDHQFSKFWDEIKLCLSEEIIINKVEIKSNK